MRLKRDRFTLITEGKMPERPAPPPPPPPAPILADLQIPHDLTERLLRIESLVKEIWNPMQEQPQPAEPVILQAQVDEAAIHHRLTNMEYTLFDIAARQQAPAVWDFSIERDRDGKIQSIRAVKNPETDLP